MMVPFVSRPAPSHMTNPRRALGDGSRQSYVCVKPSLRGGQQTYLMCYELRREKTSIPATPKTGGSACGRDASGRPRAALGQTLTRVTCRQPFRVFNDYCGLWQFYRAHNYNLRSIMASPVNPDNHNNEIANKPSRIFYLEEYENGARQRIASLVPPPAGSRQTSTSCDGLNTTTTSFLFARHFLPSSM